MIPRYFDKEYIENLCQRVEQFDLCKIILYVCDITQTDKNVLFSKTRKRNIVTIRHMLCHIFRENTNMSFTEIGKHLRFEPLDHATVLSGCNTWKDLSGQKTNVYYDEIYNKTKIKFNLK